MKGMHWTIILAIIIFAVLLVIMFTVFISPIQGQGNVFFNQTEFRTHCAWWATTDYKDTFALEGKEKVKYDMTDVCTQALKLPLYSSMSAEDWNKCKAMCRVAY